MKTFIFSVNDDGEYYDVPVWAANLRQAFSLLETYFPDVIVISTIITEA